MKKSFIRVLSVILAVTILSACLGLTAGAELKLEAGDISVNTGIKISVDGKEFVPVDSDGVPVEVFLYEGTTYLPVRGISNLFGLGIEWDGDTKSVYLGTREGADLPLLGIAADVATSPFTFESKTITVHTGVSIYFNDEYFQPTESEGFAVEVFLYNGTTYLPVRAISKLMNAEIDWDQANKTVLLSVAAEEETPAVDYKAIIKAAEDAAEIYTDMGEVLIPYYQYFLKVDAVLMECASMVKDMYLAEELDELRFYMFSTAHTGFDKQFRTQMDKAIDLYNFGKTLSKRVIDYGKDGEYTAEELEMLETNTGYLLDNQTYYGEFILACTPTEIMKYVNDTFGQIDIEGYSIVSLVSAVEMP